MVCTSAPAARSSCATMSSGPAARSSRTIDALSRASRSATARPMPMAAPVTSARCAQAADMRLLLIPDPFDYHGSRHPDEVNGRPGAGSSRYFLSRVARIAASDAAPGGFSRCRSIPPHTSTIRFNRGDVAELAIGGEIGLLDLAARHEADRGEDARPCQYPLRELAELLCLPGNTLRSPAYP